MFYQKQPNETFYFNILKKEPWNYSIHIHKFFELVCNVEDTTYVTVSGEEYVLKKGDALLIFPYQSHYFTEKGCGSFNIYTFDTKLIGSFHKQYANQLPQNNLFHFSYDFSKITPDCDLFTLKAFLYSMCANAVSEFQFHEAGKKDFLLDKIFILVEENYADCEFSLRKLADLLSYDYSYISKFFIQKTNMNFNRYLNNRRLTQAAEMLTNTSTPNIQDIAFACGYDSIRSFNRNFKLVYDCTPLAYSANPK